jgi:hypothetical protein
LHFVASDDEHLEPKFERPIPPGPNLVTARGLAQLSAKVAEIEGLVASLSEEEALKAARRDLRYWSTRLATAQLMPEPGGDVVEFGATVTLAHNGRERTITLVGMTRPTRPQACCRFPRPGPCHHGCGSGRTVDFAGKAEAVEILAIRA